MSKKRSKDRRSYQFPAMRVWSPKGLDWCDDQSIKQVLFLDQCVHLSKDAIATFRHGKILHFPDVLMHCKDEVVLRSVLNFIQENRILLGRKVKFCFVSFDKEFQRDSRSAKLLKESGIKIKFITLSLSEMVIRELTRVTVS